MSYPKDDYDADEILRDDEVSEYINEDEMDLPEVGEVRVIDTYEIDEEEY